MLKLRFADRRRPAIWLVQDYFAIGSGPDNDLILPEPGILPEHVVLRVKEDHLRIDRADHDASIRINDVACIPGDMLSVGDLLSVGDAVFQVVNPADDLAHPGSAAITANSQWLLEGKGEWLAGKTFAIDGSKLVGRDAHCDIALSGTHLSRNHARLVPDNERLRVEDLGSVNGTWVNGQRVDSASLQAGDEVRFDILTFTVHNRREDPGKTSLRPAIPDQSVLQPSLGEAIAARMAASQPTSTPAQPKPPLPAEPARSRQPAQRPPAAAPAVEKRERLVDTTLTGPAQRSGIKWLWLCALVLGAGVAAYGWFVLAT